MFRKVIISLPLAALMLLGGDANRLVAHAQAPSEIEIGGLNFPPFIIDRDGGSPRGIIVDLARRALKECGAEAKFNITNWSRAYRDAQTGVVDALIPTMETPEREQIFWFPLEPIATQAMVLVTKRVSNVQFDGTMESLKSYRIGKISKARVAPKFDQAEIDGLLSVEERVSPHLLIKAVVAGRLDVIALPKAIAFWAAGEEKLDSEITTLNPALDYVPVYLAFNREKVSKSLADCTSEALKKFKSDGTTVKIWQKYIPKM